MERQGVGQSRRGVPRAFVPRLLYTLTPLFVGAQGPNSASTPTEQAPSGPSPTPLLPTPGCAGDRRSLTESKCTLFVPPLYPLCRTTRLAVRRRVVRPSSRPTVQHTLRGLLLLRR
eukprot:4684080-Pyramimonas_sp.AAC.1